MLAPMPEFIGVIGGVGPAATSTFLDMLVKATFAEKDQDHINALVMQHASIPDRTEFLLDQENNQNPGPKLAEDALFLNESGASIIVMPCNTAHAFSESIKNQIGRAEYFSIIETTVKEVEKRHLKKIKTTETTVSNPAVTVWATKGNLSSGIYDAELAAINAKVIPPSESDIETLDEIIYGQVKQGKDADIKQLQELLESVKEAGAEYVILGCTELSVIYKQNPQALTQPGIEVVDSMRALVKRTVLATGRQLTEQYQD